MWSGFFECVVPKDFGKDSSELSRLSFKKISLKDSLTELWAIVVIFFIKIYKIKIKNKIKIKIFKAVDFTIYDYNNLILEEYFKRSFGLMDYI